MRVVHISTYDTAGGAAIAAYRIHRCLVSAGVDSVMVVREKRSGDETVIGPSPSERGIVRRGLDFLVSWLFRRIYRPSVPFSVNMRREDAARRALQHRPDVIHLHWVANECLKPESLGSFRRPIVWTLHDMWPMTGGCHYSGNCLRYREQCGACPVLRSRNQEDISRQEWRRKRKVLSEAAVTAAAPSRWMADLARSSSIFQGRRVEVVSNSIDFDVFRPGSMAECRARLALPPDCRIVLFCAAADEPRKGAALLKPALESLCREAGGMRLMVLTAGAAGRGIGDGLPVPVKCLGDVSDPHVLAACYSASDATLVPSLEDNLPNVMLESMACGTPCVAFRIGGIPEFVKHMTNGYLAEPFSASDLGRGLKMILEDVRLRSEFSAMSRAQIERKCAPAVVAGQYLQIYERALAERGIQR